MSWAAGLKGDLETRDPSREEPHVHVEADYVSR
jgi:hypothetical protein